MFRIYRILSKMSQNNNLDECREAEENLEENDNSSFSFIDIGDDNANDAKMAALEKKFGQKLTALEKKCQKEIDEFKAYFEGKLTNAAEQKAQGGKNETEENSEKNGQKMEQFTKKQTTTTTHLNVKAHLSIFGIGTSSTLRTLQNVVQRYSSSPFSTSHPFISSLDFCVQFINHHLDTTINWASHADNAYFNRLDPECRATQFLAGWATLHLIDFAYGILKGDLPFQISFRLGNKESTIDVSTITLMGCAQFQLEWTELIQQLRQYQFTEMDYEAFKYLTFFDDGIYRTFTDADEHHQLAHYREQIHQIYSQVLQSWSEIRNNSGGPIVPLLLDSLHKFGQLATKCVKQLRERVQARDTHGLLANIPDLLEEVLKNGASTNPLNDGQIN